MFLSVLYYGGGCSAMVGGVLKLWGLFENRPKLDAAGTAVLAVGYCGFLASFLIW